MRTHGEDNHFQVNEKSLEHTPVNPYCMSQSIYFCHGSQSSCHISPLKYKSVRCGLVTPVISGGHLSLHPSNHLCIHPVSIYAPIQELSIYADFYLWRQAYIYTCNHQSHTHPSTHPPMHQSIKTSVDSPNQLPIHPCNKHPSLACNHQSSPIHACISSNLASTHVSMELSIHPSTHLSTYYLLLLPPFPTVWLPHIKVP